MQCCQPQMSMYVRHQSQTKALGVTNLKRALSLYCQPVMHIIRHNTVSCVLARSATSRMNDCVYSMHELLSNDWSTYVCMQKQNQQNLENKSDHM